MIDVPLPRFKPEITIGNVLSAIVLLGGLIGIYTKTTGEMVGLNVRVGVLERAMIERRTEEREFTTEMRGSLAEIQRLVTAVRMEQAAGLHKATK